MASLWIEKRIQMIPALLLRPNQVFLFIKDMGKQGWWLLAVAWLLTSLAPALAGQFILQAEANTPSPVLVEGAEEVNAWKPCATSVKASLKTRPIPKNGVLRGRTPFFG